jgi:hypothetical protein
MYSSKKTFKTLLVLIFSFLSYTSVGINNNCSTLNESICTSVSDIDSGWYAATVRYYNSKTFTRATYTLNVYVEYNTVTKIDFGNGGSVHSGYNNSGYLYTGGNLRINKDYYGNIRSASTSVTVTYYDPFYTQSFDITIE